MLNLFEIKCLDYTGEWFEYYYCHCSCFLRGVKMAKTNAIPDKCRLVMDDRYAEPCAVRYLPPLKYLWYKYFKRRFHFGRRINWEKEKIYN